MATVSMDPQQQGITLHYFLSGSDDDAAVNSYIQSFLTAYYGGLRFNNYEAKRLGGGNWDLEVRYGTRYGSDGGTGRRKPGTITLSFDTSGEKTKITQALRQPRYYPATGNPLDAINFQGAIGIKKHNAQTKVEGIDINVTACGFTVTRSFGPDFPMNGEIVQLLRLTSWCVNADTVDIIISGVELIFQPGELLFQGGTGNQKNGGDFFGDDWEGELALKFSGSDNQTDATVAGVAGIQKDGWDYVEVIYEENDDGQVLFPKVKQVNVNPVYPLQNLMPLFMP